MNSLVKVVTSVRHIQQPAPHCPWAAGPRRRFNELLYRPARLLAYCDPVARAIACSATV